MTTFTPRQGFSRRAGGAIQGSLSAVDRIWFLAIHVLMFALLMTASAAHASSRIKDIAGFQGVRDNTLVGYGLVMGLNGTGDDLLKIGATKESLLGMLERLGVNTRADVMQTYNTAAVIVTATLPAFSRPGARIDVAVASLGNATSLSGGNLTITPLFGADNEVYAVAQGQVQIGGYSASGAAASVTKGVPTSGRIADGAIVEKEIANSLPAKTIKVALHNPDFTTARRISDAINAFLGTLAAAALDPGTVQVALPEGYKGDMVNLMTDVEQLRVEPDSPAKVVIDERTGVVVIGDEVRISTVAIAQGNLTIKVTETPQVSQPAPFSETGTTQVVPRTNIDVSECDGKSQKSCTELKVVPSGVNLQELVSGLNALGVTPRDMISILQAIKAAGAMQADLEVL